MANEDFNVRLKKALSIKNIKPIQLANMLGVNRAVISQYLSGRYKPNHHRFYDIAQALQINEAWLLGLDVPMENNDFDEVDRLYNENRTILTPDDKATIKFIIEKRIKDIDSSIFK